jgi:hypothetical protein
VLDPGGYDVAALVLVKPRMTKSERLRMTMKGARMTMEGPKMTMDLRLGKHTPSVTS